MWTTHASANGNTFLLLGGDHTECLAHLHNLRTHNVWNMDSALLVGEDADGITTMRVLERDGSESFMCGNGVRAVSAYLDTSDKKKNRTKKIRVGTRTFTVEKISNGSYAFPIDVQRIHKITNTPFTLYHAGGEPHAIAIVDTIDTMALDFWGHYFAPHANCTIVNRNGHARTFERGINRETASCGTGSCAAAMALYENGKPKNSITKIIMKGGVSHLAIDHNQTLFIGKADIEKSARRRK